MSTITKEWLQQKIADMEATRDEIPFGLSDEGDKTLAALRIALASLEAEAVVYMWDSERKDIDAPGYYRPEHLVFAESSVKQWGGRIVPLYTAPPAPAGINAEPVAWDYEWASCITCEGLQDFKRVIEREAPPEWAVHEGQARKIIPLYAAPPAPVSVPDAATAIRACMEEFPESVHDIVEECAAIAENACRAAMLQGAEPVTTANKLPDGYALVPVEPTYQMCEAMGLPWESPRFPDRYRAMIAAAPQQEVK